MPSIVFVVSLGRLLQEVVDQQRDVLAALAQRRDVDRHALDAEIQVLAELLLGDHLVQVALVALIRRTSTWIGSLRAEPHDLAVLQHAQQLGLHGVRACRRSRP